MAGESPFDLYLKENLSDYNNNDGVLSGYIEGVKHHDTLLNNLSALGYSFSTRRSEIHKQGENIWFSWKPKSNHFTPVIEFLGHAFSLEKTTYLECSQGPKYYSKHEQKNMSDHPNLKKSRIRVLDTKKLGCKAWMTVKCIRIFTDFKASNDNWRTKKKVSTQLKEALKTESVTSTLRFYVKASSGHIHNHSKVSTEINKQISTQLIQEIKHIVDSGITSVSDIKIMLDRTVEQLFSEIHKPSHLNRAFYPSDSVIYAHVYNAIYSSKQNLIDQEAIEEELKKWKEEAPGNKVYFRPFQSNENGTVESLLFCYQTSWEQHMLQRYGKLCLLDATYRTTKYSLPLFFLCVKTNVGYSVAGIFVVQAECTSLISEALTIFKQWSSNWNPLYWITDYSEMEINAIETVFPNSVVYLCVFHREQAWQRWLRKGGNIQEGSTEEILHMWRSIADSKTEEEYNNLVHEMETSNVMAINHRAMLYFQSQWLSESHRWVSCFSKKDFLFIINTNNGVESQNKILKHFYLIHNSDNTLLGMLRVVINKYLPDSLRKYCIQNSVVKAYNSDIPQYLKYRPQHFIRHVMKRLTQAKCEISKKHVNCTSNGIFSVQSSSDPSVLYTVDFGKPSCTCPDFYKFRFPCKHMCAIFEHFNEWGFDKLNTDYINSPYLTTDTTYGHSVIQNDDQMNELRGREDDSDEIPVVPNISEIKSMQQAVRNEAKRLIDMSYLCEDVNMLKEIHSMLVMKKKELENAIPTHAGLPLENKNSIHRSVSSIKRKYNMLPSRLKRKRKQKCN